MKLFIIRHGETEDNKKRVVQGKKEGRLSKKGIAQSEALAKRLSDEKIELILTSNLKRSRETAKIISKFHPNTKILIKDELNERDYGIYNGSKVSEVDKTHPSVESEKSLKERARKIINFLQSGKFQNVVIVAHGSINKRIIKILSNKEYVNFLKNGSISIIELNEEENKLIKLNDVNHLDKEIILMGGGDYRENENEKIDKFIVHKMGKKARFVFIPFAVNEPEKRKKRIKSIIEIYSQLGVKNFEIIDETKMSKQEMKNKIKKADVLFFISCFDILVSSIISKFLTPN
jgi:probable phosphoglycerate mutase